MASKPEQLMWTHLAGKMQGYWNAQRHEDELSDSIPDVSFARKGVDGWLELKIIEHWPKRESCAVNLSRLRPGQVNWMEERGKAGNGHCWLLLAVGESAGDATWVLIPHTSVRLVYDRALTRQEILSLFPHCHSSSLLQFMLSELTVKPGVAHLQQR